MAEDLQDILLLLYPYHHYSQAKKEPKLRSRRVFHDLKPDVISPIRVR